MGRFTLVRTTPPTGGESLKPRVLRELAREVQSKLNNGQALAGEVSPEYQNAIFQATVLGDGMLVSTRPQGAVSLPKLEDILYPRASLDEPIIRDTVSAVVGESLSGLDAILERARP